MPSREPDDLPLWGMFATRSSVTHLQPGTIVQCVQEAEEVQWAQGGLLGELTSSQEQQHRDLGSLLLSQSTSLKKIHSYFSQLESRKCCLHLACRQSTFNSMRLVPTLTSEDDGSAKTSQPTTHVEYLENKDLRAFKHAYLCAVYPVLAAPEPPSPLTPSPINHDPPTSSDHSSKSRRRGSTTSSQQAMGGPSPPAVARTTSRPLTPYSLHDSGVEESEEAGLIPMESVCEQLQRAFRLSRSHFRQYEAIIIKTYAKKSSQKLLAEELSGQLAVLETNNHPFYNPQKFITQNGYALWQKNERSHISELLNKFWHTSLPFPRDSQDLIAELYSIHEDYQILLKKLLQYESQFRSESETSSSGYTPLSSASWRLLLEFALRYGIGELYRKVMYLECLALDFSPTVGYLSHIYNLLRSIQQLLPINKSAVVMVKQEFDILFSSLRALKIQSCKSLAQMKTLFTGNRPSEGIGLLLSVLHTVLDLMSYLNPAQQESFSTCLKNVIQNMFKPSYELFKTVAKEDLGQPKKDVSDPRLVNVIIHNIREDVADFKNHFEGTFESYFSISKMAAVAYYEQLMEDVKTLCQRDLGHKPLMEIDLRMLALAYRLNQLDCDWRAYVTPDQQTWRVTFLTSVTQWTVAVRVHLQNLALEAVATDVYNSQNMELPQQFLQYQPPSPGSSCRSRSISASSSFSASINSAFNSLVSSVRSTPALSRGLSLENQGPRAHDVIEESYIEQQLEQNQEQHLTISPQSNPSSDELENLEPRQKNRNWDSQSLILKPSSSLKIKRGLGTDPHFSAFRQYSLPEKLNKVTLDSQFAKNQRLILGSASDSKEITSRENGRGEINPFIPTSSNESFIHHNDIQTSIESTEHSESSPFRVRSSNDSDAGTQDGQESHEFQDSSDEEVSFPPLVPVSHNTSLPAHPDDSSTEIDKNSDRFSSFAKPVFTKAKSPYFSTVEKGDQHILRADAPASLASSRASSVDTLPQDSPEPYQSNNTEDIAFPIPQSTQLQKVMLPISPSAVDLLVILQRLCCLSSNLVTMMFEESPFLLQPPHGGHVQSRRGRQSSDTGSSLSDSSSAPTQFWTPPWMNKPITSSSSSSGPTPQQLSPPLVTSSERLPHFNAHRLKLSLHIKMLKAMCNMLVVYCGNMLCMDLCGTSRVEARKLVGLKLLDYIESQQIGGLVWGCRHQAEVSHDCLFYHNRRTQLLRDRYEPVTRHMCTRINNVMACLHYLDVYHKQLLKHFNLDEELDSDERRSTSSDERDSAFSGNRSSFSLREGHVHVSHHATEMLVDEDDDLSASLKSNVSTAEMQWTSQCQQLLQSTRQHIMAVVTSLCRIMAYRLNLFVRDGLPLLLQLKESNVSMATCLAPITTFLHRYLDSLSTWLYQDSFRRVLDNLWIFIVQDIEKQTELLKTSGGTAIQKAHNWMLAMSYLIKFMNNSGHGIKKDLLLSQADDVIFQLQLYTLSTWHLISLFHSLRDYYVEGDHLTLEENLQRSPPAIVHRIHRELQCLRKCFSGAELVHWIMKNKDALPADLSIPYGALTHDTAIEICQSLMDQQFIVDIDSECHTRSDSPASSFGAMSPYPQLSVHSYLTPQLGSSRSAMAGSMDSISSSGSSTAGNNSEIETVMVHRAWDSSDSHTPTVSPKPEKPPAAPTEVDREDDNQSNNGVDISQHQLTQSASLDKGYITQQSRALAQRASVSDFRPIQTRGTLNYQRKCLTESFSDDCLFGTEKRLTPFSSLTEAVFCRTNRFQASSKKFYFVHQSLVQPGTAYHEERGSRARAESEAGQNFLKLKTSRESLDLMDQCFTHKISPLTLLAIIAGRKKEDGTARDFVKKMPKSVMNKVNSLLAEPGLECRSC